MWLHGSHRMSQKQRSRELCLLMPLHHESFPCFSSEESSSSAGIYGAIRKCWPPSTRVISSLWHPSVKTHLFLLGSHCVPGHTAKKCQSPNENLGWLCNPAACTKHLLHTPLLSGILERLGTLGRNTQKASVAINCNNAINLADTTLRKEFGSSCNITTLSTDGPKALNACTALNVVKNSFQNSFPFGNILTYGEKPF